MISSGNLRIFHLIKQINVVALDKLALKMSVSQHRRREAETQHELLRKFYDEYTLDFENTCRVGMTLDVFHNFRHFLSGLQSSIEKQNEVIVQLEHERQRLALESQPFKQKKERYQKIITKKNQALMIEVDKREQKIADSYAQQRHVHNDVDLGMPTAQDHNRNNDAN